LSIPVWHDFSAVVEMGGHTTGTIPRFNTGLSLFYGMGGVRLRVVNHTHYQPFGQTLFGSVHGFDSYFPAPVGKLPTSYDTSFALTIGGVSTSLSLNTSGSGRCRLTTSTLNSAT
jgi:outer membrane immunogenic protein